MGYAGARFTGPCFKGLVSADSHRFETSVDNVFSDCEREAKSIISDSDLDSSVCHYPAWGRPDDNISYRSTSNVNDENMLMLRTANAKHVANAPV